MTENRTGGMTRRDALKAIAAAGGAFALTSGCSPAAETAPSAAKAPPPPDRTPAIFLAHGSPPLLDDAQWVAELAGWARAMPRPKSVLMISAHWTEAPVTLGATNDYEVVVASGLEPGVTVQRHVAR